MITKTIDYTIKQDINSWVCGEKKFKYFDELLRALRYEATENLIKYLGTKALPTDVLNYSIKDNIYYIKNEWVVDFRLIARTKDD